MEKITFVDNETKANASTFNTMQNNIENGINTLKPVILFDGNTAGDVTLSETSANFNYIEVFYYASLGINAFCSQKIFSPNNNYININSVHRDSGQQVLFFCSKIMKFEGNKLNKIKVGHSYLYNGLTPIAFTEDDYLYIKRVVGYR